MVKKMINLQQGQVIKNYKELCIILDVEPTKGKGRQFHIREFERYCSYHKDGNKFIIDEVFTDPKPKIDNRKNNNSGNNNKYFKQYKVNGKHNKKSGVYIISLDNKVYIGSTMAGLRKRFLQHLDKYNNLPTKEMLENDGTFEALWISENNENEDFVRNMENYYIDLYKKNNKFVVVNEKPAWSYTRKERIEYLNIKVKKENFNKVKELLSKYDLLA